MRERIERDINSNYYQQNFDNDGQRFVAWYVQNIHRRDQNETVEDVTDGPNDRQIDAIVVDDDASTVYVIRGKFIRKGTVDSEPLREVLASWVQLKNIVELQAEGNEKLKRRLPEFRTALEEDYNVSFELIVTGELTEGAKNVLEHFQRELTESDDFPAEIHIVDEDKMRLRFDMALDRVDPKINHQLELENGKYMDMKLDGTNCIVAAIPLKECIKFPGIKDGTLFQKNVRQALGNNNRVNKGMKETIYGPSSGDFFFMHNGITATCDNVRISDNQLSVENLNVVNGCQSLNTMYSCSEQVNRLEEAYVMFRFYEVPQRERTDRISISTNSQSTVKPRDLRSNDLRVVGLKNAYEHRYPNGYFKTKRGEVAPAEKDKTQEVDLLDLGKYLIAWHSQRPNVSYSETKIFDRYFEQLFRRNEDYDPQNVFALHQWMTRIKTRWENENPLNLNPSLLAMRAYAPYHHLYGISILFCDIRGIPNKVPNPFATYQKAEESDLIDQIVDATGTCLNTALEAATNEPQRDNRVFSPQNWIKTKSCLANIRQAVTGYLRMMPLLPEGQKLHQELVSQLRLDDDQFEERWAAD